MATNTKLKKLLWAYGPETQIAYARWAPSGSTTQTLTESQGITGITRTSAGLYVATLAVKPKAILAMAQAVENSTTVRHTARVDSSSLTAGTVTVSLRSDPGTAVVRATIADVSTASTAYTVAPIAGTITSVYGVLGGAISGANSTVTTSIAGVAITNGSFVVAFSGSAAGDVDSATPTALNTVTAGQSLSAATNGNSTDTATEDVYFVIQGQGTATDTVDELELLVVMRTAS